MSALDWGIVPLLNGSIIAYGLYWSCGVVAIGWAPSAVWLVGLSMYATAIDSSDMRLCPGALSTARWHWG